MTNLPGVDTQKATLDELSSLCRGEISAVETYAQAMNSPSLTAFTPQLRRCQQSHQQRRHLLAWRIQALGGIAPESSGAWGIFARMVEGCATAIGEKAAIAALKEGEEHGLDNYRECFDKLDANSREFVHQRLFPAQQETHRVIGTLTFSLENTMPSA
jgi:Domain of unknown function (DUF2383)